MPTNHLKLCHLLLLLPSIFPSIRVFYNESALPIRWPKYWSFSFSISPSSEYSGLISFRIDWFDLHAVQGTLKRFLQYHYSKASTLWCSAFFMVQLLTSIHNYWKNHMDICLQTDVSAFNILSSFVMGPSLVDQIIKNLPATQEMWVQSLGQTGDPTNPS